MISHLSRDAATFLHEGSPMKKQYPDRSLHNLSHNAVLTGDNLNPEDYPPGYYQPRSKDHHSPSANKVIPLKPNLIENPLELQKVYYEP